VSVRAAVNICRGRGQVITGPTPIPLPYEQSVVTQLLEQIGDVIIVRTKELAAFSIVDAAVCFHVGEILSSFVTRQQSPAHQIPGSGMTHSAHV